MGVRVHGLNYIGGDREMVDTPQDPRPNAEKDAPLGMGWERVHRDLTSRLGFGDGITEPMADNDTIVEFFDQRLMEASEHNECAVTCEPCGERLAFTVCEHCHGCGANVALSTASGAYSECEWCAGAGKVHAGCAEQSYADLAADRDKFRLWWEQAERRRAEVEQILDRVLGTEEEDGAGEGLVADVLLAVQKAWDTGYSAGVCAPANRVLGLGEPANPYRPLPPADGGSND